MALAQSPNNIFNKLKIETLKEVAVERKTHEDETLEKINKKALVKDLSHEVECFGIKKLTQMMKRNTLQDICDFHEIDHKDNNPNNKAVLTKRVYEQMSAIGVKAWLSKCKDEDIITQLCDDMEIEYTEADSPKELKSMVEQYIFDFGAQVFFNKLQLKTLRDCAGDMKLKNRNVNSKPRLCQAVITVSDVEVPKKKKAVKKTKKVPIRRALDKNVLMQHYYASELKDWCAENGLKTSGNKKVLAERIAAYNNGDKENTMATEKPVRKSTKKSTKKTTKKSTKPSRTNKRKQEEVVEEVEEVEEEEVEEEVEEEEQEEERLSKRGKKRKRQKELHDKYRLAHPPARKRRKLQMQKEISENPELSLDRQKVFVKAIKGKRKGLKIGERYKKKNSNENNGMLGKKPKKRNTNNNSNVPSKASKKPKNDDDPSIKFGRRYNGKGKSQFKSKKRYKRRK
eukprot:TRINITY_DN698_c0_g1_i3.p1 TRINITY_DN698_c0_g1~~TRINITY_DN698_c0_g1_i3.p1  ORF type:complete len:455 (-),score=217.19 TRINITY_DN698_c0_g1_i3:22-1386(-)